MDRVLQRRDTAANWSSVNPILAEGEIGIITDGAKGYKIGDGLTRWNALEFPANPTSVVGELGDSEVAVINLKAVTAQTEKLYEYTINYNSLSELTWVQDSAVNYTTGGIYSNIGYSRTEHIYIPNYIKNITVRSSCLEDDDAGIAFYTSDLIYISGVKLNKSNTDNTLLNTSIPVPENANSCRFTCLSSLRDKANVANNNVTISLQNLNTEINKVETANIQLEEIKLTSKILTTEFPNLGYLSLTGAVVSMSSGNWHYCGNIEIPKNVKTISYLLYQFPGTIGMICFYDNAHYFISSISDDGTGINKAVSGTATIPDNACYVRVSCRTDYPHYFSFGYDFNFMQAIAENNNDYILTDTIVKPMIFSGANCIAFGDSIMKGYLPDNNISDSPWIKIISDLLQFNNLTNRAVGGAGFTLSNNSIISQITDQTLDTRDYIFISAGTNDYNYCARSSVFEASVEEAFSYIDSNKGNLTKVIVITPINRSKPTDTYNPLSLDWYRDCITKKALLHGYSVIDGSKIGFSSVENDYQDITMSDGLHPTDIGYKIYANHILSLIS